MPTYIRDRSVNGGRRFDVTYRRGGRGYPLEHAGTFKTQREAGLRRRLVDDWLAVGKDPKRELALLIQPAPKSMRFEALAEAWLQSRVDLDETTIGTYSSHLRQLVEAFGPMPASEIRPEDVIDWVGEMVSRPRPLKPGTVRQYVSLLRMILDVFDDNPARHRSVRLPKQVRAIRDPPDAGDYLEMLEKVNPAARVAVVLMEQTGMRISEAHAVAERDIDRDNLRVLVADSKTDRPRWIPLQPWYAQVIEPVTIGEHTSRWQMRKVAPHIHPHLLRHRRGTLWHQSGVYATELAARLGHANATESLNTYAHVRPISEADSSRVLDVLGR